MAGSTAWGTQVNQFDMGGSLAMKSVRYAFDVKQALGR
jgi:hypothetical protein